jgi:hypothetical protein
MMSRADEVARRGQGPLVVRQTADVKPFTLPPDAATQKIAFLACSGKRRMLETLARRCALRVTRAQLGTFAGFTASGGTFGAYLGALRRNGLVEVNGDQVRASETLFLN